MPPEPCKVINLRPGEFTFAEGNTVLQTLLGSCVAITFWEPRRKLGAMCHYILPARPPRNDHSSPGSYADETIPAIADRFISLGVRADDLEVRMFGGGNMFPMQTLQNEPLIGDKNITAGRRLLEALGFSITQADLAGEVRRRVVFEVHTGRVQVERGDVLGSTREVRK